MNTKILKTSQGNEIIWLALLSFLLFVSVFAHTSALSQEQQTTHLVRVYFDYDSHELSSESKSVLDENVKKLKATPDLNILIEGHTDERGSADYNVALGKRRAEAVRRYLLHAGIAANRIRVVSFGKQKPLDFAQTPAAWAKNRRAEFAIVDKHFNYIDQALVLPKDSSYAIAILQLYTGETHNENVDLTLLNKAMTEQGFTVHHWTYTPNLAEFDSVLNEVSQLWIISDETRHLSDFHLQRIRRFFDAGHGLYILGDNEPFFEDANYVTESLFQISMYGDVLGNQVVSRRATNGGPGFVAHKIMTGVNFLYEGITIATIVDHPDLQPLIYGSGNNLVAAIYDKLGKRAIIDGGFTRLYDEKWDNAGTAKYVQNVAVWLINKDSPKLTGK
ncbi:MAG: peptidoglycan-associated lipoprotein Pal [bacterium]